MQAAIEAAKATIIPTREAQNQVCNAKPAHAVSRSGGTVLNNPYLIVEWQQKGYNNIEIVRLTGTLVCADSK